MPEADRLNYLKMEGNYDVWIWSIMAPVAGVMYEGDNAQMNQSLGQLGKGILRARPKWYAIWVAKATRQACRKILGDFFANLYGAIALLTLSVIYVWRQRSSAQVAATPVVQHAEFDLVSIVLTLTSVFAVCSLALIVLVCPPLGRFTDAAGVFLPALVTALIASQVQSSAARSN